MNQSLPRWTFKSRMAALIVMMACFLNAYSWSEEDWDQTIDDLTMEKLGFTDETGYTDCEFTMSKAKFGNKKGHPLGPNPSAVWTKSIYKGKNIKVGFSSQSRKYCFEMSDKEGSVLWVEAFAGSIRRVEIETEGPGTYSLYGANQPYPKYDSDTRHLIQYARESDVCLLGQHGYKYFYIVCDNAYVKITRIRIFYNLDMMEDVVYTPDGGDVFVGDTLRLSCETNGVWLYYSMDNDKHANTQYNSPGIVMKEAGTHTVYARSRATNFHTYSDIFSRTFNVKKRDIGLEFEYLFNGEVTAYLTDLDNVRLPVPKVKTPVDGITYSFTPDGGKEDVAQVDEYGNLTLLGAPGAGTVTASYPGDYKYNAAEVSYRLNVKVFKDDVIDGILEFSKGDKYWGAYPFDYYPFQMEDIIIPHNIPLYKYQASFSDCFTPGGWAFDQSRPGNLVLIFSKEEQLDIISARVHAGLYYDKPVYVGATTLDDVNSGDRVTDKDMTMVKIEKDEVLTFDINRKSNNIFVRASDNGKEAGVTHRCYISAIEVRYRNQETAPTPVAFVDGKIKQGSIFKEAPESFVIMAREGCSLYGLFIPSKTGTAQSNVNVHAVAPETITVTDSEGIDHTMQKLSDTNEYTYNSPAAGYYIIMARDADGNLSEPAIYVVGNSVSGSVGIDNIEEDSTSTEERYFNLQGTEVKNPANGIFIRVKNGKATKVAL